ncbi:MAG: putative drug resistance transporter [Rhodospirillales bacterium]|nr:putative drug resistance transporter [Rhodospirillales bacterium]
MTASSVNETTLAVPRARLYLLLGALIAFPSLSIDMYLPAFPSIQTYFHTDAGSVQRTLAVFSIGFAIGQLFFGPLSDRLGRRRPLIAGILLYIAGTSGILLAPSIEIFTLGRVVQAFGGCAAALIGRAMVRDLFHERDAARVFSLLMLIMGLAPILAPLVGGQLLVVFGWQGIFVLLVVFAALSLVVVIFGLGETLPPERRETRGLGSVFTVYRGLLSDRRFCGYVLSMAFASAGMLAYITGSPFVFIRLHGVPPQLYGLLFGANALGLIASSQLNRRLLRRYTDETLLKRALGVTTVAGIILGLAGLLDLGGLPGLMAPLFVCISSLGFILPNATAAALARSGSHAGSAVALLGGVQFAMAASASALVSALEDGTALPMCGTIMGLVLAAFALHRLLVERPA